MEIIEIDKIIDKLKSSPLFYLFVSSRELFNTNFWYWLFTIDAQETFKIFSNDYKEVKEIQFKREHNQKYKEHKANIDLLISFNNDLKIIVENKIKDFPTEDQLYRIKNSFNNEQFCYLLITLFWTENLNFDGWKILTYNEMSKRINPENYATNEYYKNLILDYKVFTSNLANLASILPVNNIYDFAITFEKELYSKLNEIKLSEGYQKMRASHLVNNFQKNNYHNVLVQQGINNKKSTIHFQMQLINSYKIGIQIEDTQFRRYVIGPKIGPNTKRFAENLIAENLFLNDNTYFRSNKKYLNFGDEFKYQYENIKEPISFEKLFKRINLEFDFIVSNIDKIKNKIPSS